MQLASRFASRSPVLRSAHPLSDDQTRAVHLRGRAPHESRSERYSYILTAAVLQELRGEPLRDGIGDQWFGRSCRAQHLDHVGGGLRVPLAFIGGVGEEGGEIVAMHGLCHGNDAAPDAPEHAACGFPVTERGRHVARDGLADRKARVPRAQHGEFTGIGKADRFSGGQGARPHPAIFLNHVVLYKSRRLMIRKLIFIVR